MALTEAEQRELDELELAALEAEASTTPDGYSPSMLDTAINKGISGATAGFSDEIAGGLEAAGAIAGLKGLGRKVKDVGFSEDGPTIDLDKIKRAYQLARDQERNNLSIDSKTNPGTSMASEILSSLVSPVNKLTGGMGLIKQGAVYGGTSALGGSEGDLQDQAINTALGTALGGATSFASPYIGRAASKVGDKLKGGAYDLAYMATKPGLAAIRNTPKETRRELGKFAIDNKITGAFKSKDKMFEKANELARKSGLDLEDIYEKARVELSGRDIGFNPSRDKEIILQRARQEVGNVKGAEAAVEALSNHIDEVASRRSGLKGVEQYKKDYKEYLKDRKKLPAGTPDEQFPLLQTDDLQRTSQKTVYPELVGKEANILKEEPLEYMTQPELRSLLTKTDDEARPVSGDFMLGQRQNADAKKALTNLMGTGYQSEIFDTGIVPRTFGKAEVPSTASGSGQLEMLLGLKNKPIRPDLNMTPKEAQELKSIFDQQINYSKNPLSPDKATESAYIGARRAMSDIIDKDVRTAGSTPLLEALKGSNKKYGSALAIKNSLKDAIDRSDKNNMFGLTDYIAGAGALGYGASTGDVGTPLAMLAGKKGLEKYGLQTGAALLNALGKGPGSEKLTPALSNMYMELYKKNLAEGQ